MIKMGKNVFIAGLFLLAGIAAISFVLMPLDARADSIKVGVIDCYSGPAAVFGNDALNGFKMALEEINKQGVLGQKIEYTTAIPNLKLILP